MGKKRDAERRTFEGCRAIDVTDQKALRFWSKRLGVSADAIAEAVKDVGPNATAVALKLEAPSEDRVAPPELASR